MGVSLLASLARKDKNLVLINSLQGLEHGTFRLGDSEDESNW